MNNINPITVVLHMQGAEVFLEGNARKVILKWAGLETTI